MPENIPETPRIYVACLAAYNAGRLHGRWIDAAQDAADIQAEVRKMLAASPQADAEEWAIHDYEGFGPLPQRPPSSPNIRVSARRCSATLAVVRRWGQAVVR